MTRPFVFIIAVLLAASPAAGQGTTPDPAVGDRFAPDRVLIRWSDGGLMEVFSEEPLSTGEFDLPERLGLPSGVRILPGGVSGLRARGPATTTDAGFVLAAPYQVVLLDGRMTVAECLEKLRDHPFLDYAEPDRIGEGGGVEPDDPDFSSQWHHETIQSADAWSIDRGSEEVIVAVLDTGINGSEVEFEGRLVPGYDFVNNGRVAHDDHGHGTAVAGVIAANADNGHLVAGVDWKCRVMPLKVLDDENRGFYSAWADAIYFAVANGARVINLSAGGHDSGSTLAEAVRFAVDEGVVFVTITHNDGTGTIRFPGRMPETITVGATERDDRVASFSNWGDEIDLVAPGRDIYTVSRSGSLTRWWGTSFSAPQAAGVAALLLAVSPELDNEGVRRLLRAGAEDRVGDSRDRPGFDPHYGWGRLNAYYSVQLAITEIREVERMSDGSIRLRWPAPENAPTKSPFEIQYSDDLDTWHTVSFGSEYSLTGEFGEWYDAGDEERLHPALAPERFYRVAVRE